MAEYVVGLRGGIGTGKSMVSDLFAERGIVVADADISARAVVEPGRPAFLAIVDRFGEQILQEDGNLDRSKMRDIVFTDALQRQFLEQQTHGPIIEDLLHIIRQASSAYAILVLSTGVGKNPMMQRLLVVDAPPETQIDRVMRRDNNSRSQVEAILKAQPSREVRKKDADDLIVNDAKASLLNLEVEKLHQLYLSLASEQRKRHG